MQRHEAKYQRLMAATRHGNCLSERKLVSMAKAERPINAAWLKKAMAIAGERNWPYQYSAGGIEKPQR